MIKYEKPQLVKLSEEIMTLGAFCEPGSGAGGDGFGPKSCATGYNATAPQLPACGTGNLANRGCNVGNSPIL